MNNVLFLDGALFDEKTKECSEVFTKLTDLLGCMDSDKETMLSCWMGEAKDLWVREFQNEMNVFYEDIHVLYEMIAKIEETAEGIAALKNVISGMII